MKYKDIDKFPISAYSCNIPLAHLKKKVEEWENEKMAPLEMNPDFQRGHVWNDEQRSKYVEYILRGGQSACIYIGS